MTRDEEAVSKPGALEKHRKKSAGRPQTWNPKVTVKLNFTPESAAYFKARMDEYIIREGL